MALKFSVALRNAILDGMETLIGVAAILQIRSEAPPANCAAADTGDVLATLELPSDWMANAAAGAKSKSGTWADLYGDMDGTAGHFSIYSSDPSDGARHAQGICSLAAGGGDMILNSLDITTTNSVTVESFTITAGNA